MSNINIADLGSESDDEPFNPAPAIGSDDEADDVEEQPQRDSNRQERSGSSRPAQNGAGQSSKQNLADDEAEEGGSDDDNGEDDEGPGRDLDNEEDDEEEDEEDEDDDEIRARPSKRARRDPRNQFIDIEAEVDDEDEPDEEDDIGEADGFITGDHPDDIAGLADGLDRDDRGHRELDAIRDQNLQIDAEETAAIFKARYGRKDKNRLLDNNNIPKRMLLPSVEDPSIWGVRCKPGKEREVMFSILKRIEERMFSKSPLAIISAFERGGVMAGYVYVEARKQSDILASLDGIMNLFPRTKMVLIPIKEMPDLLRTTKSKALQIGGYVRIKRGKYMGDLAQIDDIEDTGLDVTLKIVPRLSYGLDEDLSAPMVSTTIGDAAKRKRDGAFGANNVATRPPPRLFSEAEAKKKHSKYLVKQSNYSKQWTYLNETYIDGFLIKDFKVQHLITENVNPTLEEVTRFAVGAEDGTENLDLAALANSIRNTTAGDSYLPGDVVEVWEGEQQGAVGKAVNVTAEIVTMTVTEGPLKGQKVEVPMKALRKRFKEGDHVKVIGGSRYRDEVGMVIKISEDRVTILSDMSMQEITVFSKDLREASDSGVAGGLGQYDIHDLVQLDPARVGCVIKVDRESLKVIDQNSAIQSVLPSQISGKIERKRDAVAVDRNGSEIRVDDTVREIGGEKRQGVILHIHRSFLFLHNREQKENSGVIVTRAANVATVAAKGGRIAGAGAAGGPDLSRMNPSMQRNGANGSSNGSMMPPPKSFGRDPVLGKTVTIRKGPYKGLLGIVKDTTDKEARVELHTKSKTVSVAKDILSIKDPITGQSIDINSFSGRGRGAPSSNGSYGPGGGYSAGGATPRYGANVVVSQGYTGARTPLGVSNDGGRTPAWGAAPARTPAWGESVPSRTPRWASDGGRTPAWAAAASGGATAYGGGFDGGRTPAWESGSRTAYGSSETYNPPSNSNKTPLWSSSRTPAYTPSFNAPTPAAHEPWNKPFDAPTPAAANSYAAYTPGVSAPTPRAMDAPTPGAGLGAPTPYAEAETPAAWGGEVRYADSPSP